jgi:hypothetical protein
LKTKRKELKMKVMVMVGEAIVFTDSLDEDIELRQKYFSKFASPGTEIEVVATRVTSALRCDGVSCTIAPGAENLPDMVDAAVQYEKDGFDAIAFHGG